MRHERAFPGDAVRVPTRSSIRAASINGDGAVSATPSTRTRCRSSSTPRGSNDELRLQGVPGRPTATPNDRLHPARPVQVQARREPVSLDEVEPASGDHEALLHRRDVLRLDFLEAHQTLAIAMNRLGRQEQHRRGRRGLRERFTPEPNGDSRRSAIKQVASGRFGVTSLVSRELGRDADQDRPGREARRGWPAPGPQGRRDHRQDAPLDAGCRSDLAAAPPRHLLDRGSRPADPRPEERQPLRATCQREARGRDRCWHRRGGCLQGQGRRRADQRSRRRNRRLAADVHQVRRPAPGRSASPRPSRRWS